MEIKVIDVVVVTAGDSERRLGELLGGGGLSVLYAETPAVSFAGEGPDLIFVRQREPGRAACRDAVLVVRRGTGLPGRIDCENAVAVIDSSNAQALEQVARRRLRALTCGLSGADTFTVSSLTPDSAVVSLQREITAFDGSAVEPFELPVALHGPVDPFTLLSCAAVFCLLGARNPLAGEKRWLIPARPARPQDESGNRFWQS